MVVMEPIFPGMDPYIESSGLWPGFHEAFLTFLTDTLQPLLPAAYYAHLVTREEVGIGGVDADLVVRPDVSIKSRPPDSARLSTSTGETTLPSGGGWSVPETLVIVEAEPITVSSIEIREVPPGGRLVTLIELLSPSNKAPGPDREAFERKQGALLSSAVNWIEVDLLRSGTKVACHPRVGLHCQAKNYDYSIVVSRGSRRSPQLTVELYGFNVRNSLPTLAVPLREPDPDVLVDLGEVFRRTYRAGPYHKVLRYDLPPTLPFSPADREWARGLVAARTDGGH
jgi:hypothetical protein